VSRLERVAPAHTGDSTDTSLAEDIGGLYPLIHVQYVLQDKQTKK
jgi:hypothetical protein